MKIIVRDWKGKIDVVNLTSKEEMVWIDQALYSEITTEASKAAMDFMKRYPQIHEVKFSVWPQLDEEENEEDFHDGERSGDEDECRYQEGKPQKSMEQ